MSGQESTNVVPQKSHRVDEALVEDEPQIEHVDTRRETGVSASSLMMSDTDTGGNDGDYDVMCVRRVCDDRVFMFQSAGLELDSHVSV